MCNKDGFLRTFRCSKRTRGNHLDIEHFYFFLYRLSKTSQSSVKIVLYVYILFTQYLSYLVSCKKVCAFVYRITYTSMHDVHVKYVSSISFSIECTRPHLKRCRDRTERLCRTSSPRVSCPPLSANFQAMQNDSTRLNISA